MATSTHIRIGAAAAFAAAAAAVTVSLAPAAARPGGAGCDDKRTLLAETTSSLHSVQTLGHLRPTRPAYGWPVAPFDRQHPVRAFLDDPRIGARGGRAFHFGIDVAAPDGTAVYAVAGGEIFFSSAQAIAVKTGPAHEFGYWHIVPAVRPHQIVGRHQLLGHIARGWGHVHFAERIGDRYVNPLRPGGLGPYTDPVAPQVAEISLDRRPDGGLEVLAAAYDTTWPRVPGPWAGEPVTPALLQWRVLRDGRPLGGWRTVADFRSHMLDARLFGEVYAPETAQNHKGVAGRYCFYLSHAWKPADGSYRIEVAASDTAQNRTVAQLDFDVAHGEVRR